MPTELFKRAKPPACFAPKLTPEDIPRLREILRGASKGRLLPWANATAHTEVVDRYVQTLLSDTAGKFDQLAKDIALEWAMKKEHVSPSVFEPMYDLLAALTLDFLSTPESEEKPHILPVHAVRNGQPISEVALTPLADAEATRIWDLVPWWEELEMYHLAHFCLPDGVKVVTDETGRQRSVPANQTEFEIKNASQHLLWYADELYLDREPTTQERVG